MHSYSIDKKIRTTISIVLFVASIVLSILLRSIISPYVDKVTAQMSSTVLSRILEFISSTGIFPNFLEAAAIFSLLSIVFEKWIWKLRPVRFLHGIPDLNGHWEGELHSSYSDEVIHMNLDIVQTWSEISFRSTFPKSTSCSNTAAIHMEDNRGISIYFGFHNDSTDIASGMQSYDGYNILTMIDNDTEYLALKKQCNNGLYQVSQPSGYDKSKWKDAPDTVNCPHKKRVR